MNMPCVAQTEQRDVRNNVEVLHKEGSIPFRREGHCYVAQGLAEGRLSYVLALNIFVHLLKIQKWNITYSCRMPPS